MDILKSFFRCESLLVCSVSFGIVVMPVQAMQTRQLDVSTNIDRSMMLADTVTLEFDPVSATLLFDKNAGKFFDQHFSLAINSTLDSQDDYVQNGYQLTLTENNSTCYDSISSTSATAIAGYESIATVHLDSLSNPMVLNFAKDIAAFGTGTTAGVKAASEHSIILTYPVINNDNVRYCEGNFVLGFRYNL
ncbi:hypothetical protein [Vibrio hippocampi]|uniref:Uncharacterized protein n=1 Tax=Vibrio hippocampi TaxID=654686 RepID=A0ABM8ZKI6_9VIBR|nr:hypothetical protein [Vibrio hippocampi]CAH0527341.1 hypothetical protein VHP8226_02660 [Vibrio hippocampi]